MSESLGYATPDDLVPWERNPRVNEHAVDAVARSIERFGFGAPIVARRSDGRILAGHTRWKAARNLGLEKIPVRWMEIDDQEATALTIVDNKIGEIAEWDDEMLAEVMRELDDVGDAEGLGFSEREIDEMLGRNEGEIRDEGPGEVPEEPRTKPGDLWILGRHRLLCGDSTDSRDVMRVLTGETPRVCVTDPPYAVEYEKSHEARGGSKAVHGAYQDPKTGAAALAFLDALPPGIEVAVMSFPVDRHLFDLAAALERNRFDLRKELVWVKDSPSFWPGATYQQQHEPILVCARRGRSVLASEKMSTVLRAPRPKAHDLHPTARPLDLWTDLVRAHVDDQVFEPFAGSGTTLIAAEELGRTAFAIEIAAAYCDVIVGRWERFTGETARLA